MYHLDVWGTLAINALAGHAEIADLAMMWISAFAVPAMVLAVAGQWWRRADRQSVRHVLLASGLSFLLGLGMNQIILLFVHRMRPYDAGLTMLLVAPSADPSFPSDHATAAFAIAAAFLLHGMRRLGFGFLAAAALVGFSRIYIGTHYVSDVLGGALIGTVAAVVVFAAYREGTRLDRLVTGLL